MKTEKTIKGTITQLRAKGSPKWNPWHYITVERKKIEKEHINESFRLYYDPKKIYFNPKVGLTVKARIKENKEKYEDPHTQLWGTIYADLLAIHCPYRTINMKPPFINKWRNADDFEQTLISHENPNKNSEIKWIPIVNYERITNDIHGNPHINNYKQGSRDWRNAANEELERFKTEVYHV